MVSNLDFLEYYDLPEGDRERILNTLGTDDARRRLIEEAGILRDLFTRLQEDDDDHLTIEMIIELKVAQHFGIDLLPPEQRARFVALDRRVRSDPELAAEAEKIEAHLDELLSGADPVQQFEQLSGHNLSEAVELPSKYARRSRAKSTGRYPDIFGIHPAVVFSMAIVVGLFLLYGGLYLISIATTHPAVRMAPDVNMAAYTVPGPLRGIEAAAVSPTVARLHTAASLVAESKRSILGLFPSVDESKLAEARGLLEEITTEAPADSYFATEAYYLNGIIALLLEQPDEARHHFALVIEHGGRMTLEARRLLDQLD